MNRLNRICHGLRRTDVEEWIRIAPRWFHSSTGRPNAYRCSLGATCRGGDFIKRYRVLMMRPEDGTLVYARISEPRVLLQLPLKIEQLDEDARRARLASRRERRRERDDEDDALLEENSFDFRRYMPQSPKDGR